MKKITGFLLIFLCLTFLCSLSSGADDTSIFEALKNNRISEATGSRIASGPVFYSKRPFAVRAGIRTWPLL